MLLKYFRVALLILSLSAFPAHSVIITSIDNLDIGGTFYDVTFHQNLSFHDVFDADADGIFGEGDSSLINHAPTFWNGQQGAFAATQAIMQHLGQFYTTISDSDQFAVPYSDGGVLVNLYIDSDRTTSADIGPFQSSIVPDFAHPFVPFASFELSSTSVPVPTPPTLTLVGLAFSIIAVMGRIRPRILD